MDTSQELEDIRDNVLPFRPIEAMEQAETLTEKYPGDADVHFFLASIYKNLNRLTEAAQTFERCHSVNPKAYMALFGKAICFWEQGKPEEALAQFERAAIGAESDSILPALLTGLTIHRLGDPKSAIERYSDILKSAPTNAALLYCLSNAMRDCGQHKEATQQARLIQKGFKRYRQSAFDLVEFLQGYDFFGWKQWADKDAFANSAKAWCHATNTEWPHFLPRTYVMPEDFEALKEKTKTNAAKDPIWIIKSTTLNAAVGTHLVNKIDNVKAEAGWIAQDYVSNPYLIYGRKFALRLFMLVTSFAPPRVYLYQGGTAKFALRKYTTDPNTFHLTSVHTEHTRPDRHRTDLKQALAAEVGEKGWWSTDELFLYLEKQGVKPAQIWEQARAIATTLVQAMENQGFFRNHAGDGIHHAYGPKYVALDLTLDADTKLWLSEIERGPTNNRIFNSDDTVGATFSALANMYVCPMDDDTAEDLETRTAQFKAHEHQYRGRFALIHG